MIEIPLLAGITAGLFRIGGDVLYIRATFHKPENPHIITWVIWVVLTVEIFFSSLAKGLSYSLFVAFIAMCTTTYVLYLVVKSQERGWRLLLDLFRFKSWKELSFPDNLCFPIGIAGAVIWLITTNPFYALVAGLVADLAASTAMLPKALKEPWTEPKIAWTLFLLSGIANLFSPSEEVSGVVHQWTYVISMFVSDGLVWATLMVGTFLICNKQRKV